MNDDANKHWLVRKSTIKGLWIIGSAILAVTVVAEYAINMHGEFGLDELFAFNAWFGLLACAAMIVGAKILGGFLSRPDDYYDSGDDV